MKIKQFAQQKQKLECKRIVVGHWRCVYFRVEGFFFAQKPNLFTCVRVYVFRAKNKIMIFVITGSWYVCVCMRLR